MILSDLRMRKDFVLIELHEPKQFETSGGIVVPTRNAGRGAVARAGRIIAIGPDVALYKFPFGRIDKSMYLINLLILASRYGGEEFEWEGKSYLVVKSKAILGSIEWDSSLSSVEALVSDEPKQILPLGNHILVSEIEDQKEWTGIIFVPQGNTRQPLALKRYLVESVGYGETDADIEAIDSIKPGQEIICVNNCGSPVPPDVTRAVDENRRLIGLNEVILTL